MLAVAGGTAGRKALPMSNGNQLEHRALGTGGLTVSAIGLGCMSLSGVYGEADDAASEALIRYAIDQGVDHFEFIGHVWLGT